MLVDFWAPWCGPCKFLGPTLAKMAEEFDGAFALVKVDTDANPGLAQRYGIQGIPDVKLFQGGKVVDGFVGALPAPEVRRFLKDHLPGEEDDHLAAARKALAEGKVEAVREHVEAIDESHRLYEEAQHVLAAAGFWSVCREARDVDAVRAAVKASPEDLDAQYRLGCCLAVSGDLRGAMEAFMAVIRPTGKRYREGAAHRGMLTLFGLAGRHSDLSDEFKRQLQIYI